MPTFRVIKPNYKRRVRTDKQDALVISRRFERSILAGLHSLKQIPLSEADYVVLKIMLEQEIPPLVQSARILVEEMEDRPGEDNLIR